MKKNTDSGESIINALKVKPFRPVIASSSLLRFIMIHKCHITSSTHIQCGSVKRVNIQQQQQQQVAGSELGGRGDSIVSCRRFAFRRGTKRRREGGGVGRKNANDRRRASVESCLTSLEPQSAAAADANHLRPFEKK